MWLASLGIPAGLTVLSASSGFSVSGRSSWGRCCGDREEAVPTGKVMMGEWLERSVGIAFLDQDGGVIIRIKYSGQWLGDGP